MSDATSPRLVGSVVVPGKASGVHVIGGTVYLASGEGGLFVLEAQPSRVYLPMSFQKAPG